MAGYTSTDPCQGTLLIGTSALQCAAGVIGAAAGQAYDSLLYGVYIQFNATAATVLIGGMKNSSGAAANILVSGSATVDYFWMPPAPILNSFGALVFTPSISALVWVFLRAYAGPERPEPRVTS